MLNKKFVSTFACAVLISQLVSTNSFAAPFNPVTKTQDGSKVVADPVVKIGSKYTVSGIEYIPGKDDNYDEVGFASWYGDDFHGKLTSNGEVFDMNNLTAAHPTLPMPCFVEVTNLDNGKKIVVRVNDRGPFASGRVIDLSKRAAILLGYVEKGTAHVRVKVLPEISEQAAMEINKINVLKNKSMDKKIPVAETPLKNKEEIPTLNNDDNIKNVADKKVVEITPTPLPAPTPVASVVTKAPVPQVKTVSVAPLSASDKANDSDPLNMVAENPGTLDGIKTISLEEPSSIKSYIPRGVFVQVGAFSETNSKIQSQLASLSDIGVVSLHKVDLNGKDVLRLRVGPYGSIDDAVKIKDKLVNLGYSTSRVVVEQ